MSVMSISEDSLHHYSRTSYRVCLFVTLVGPGVREQRHDECGRDDVSDRRGDGRHLLRLLLRQVRESSFTHTRLVVSCVLIVMMTTIDSG